MVAGPRRGGAALTNGIAAVVVSFNPDVQVLKSLLAALGQQVQRVYLVDNDSACDPDDWLNDREREHTVLLRLDHNKGIAAAQNVGIRRALSEGSEHVIFFDQDSCLPAGFVACLAEELSDASIVAPVFFDTQRKFGYPLVDIKLNGLRVKYRPENLAGPVDISVAISSGTLVSRPVFERAGLMDERLFIDYVDTEWCLRCARLGWFVRIKPQARMAHSIGERTVRLGPFRMPIHGPARRYYRIRNAFLLLRYPHIPLLMCLREIAIGLVHQLVHVMYTKHRMAHIRIYLRAVSDGLRGVSGPSSYGGRDE